MRRLRDFQDITLILEGHRAPAIVVATSGDRLWLEPHGDAQLVRAALPASAHIAFAHQRQYVLLAGRAEAHTSGVIMFQTMDRAHVPNVRAQARLPIRLPVRLECAGTTVTGTTNDLGSGGLHVDARLAGRADDVAQVRIELPDDLADVYATVRIVRADARGTALAFVDLDPAEAERIEAIVIAVRRRIAQHRIKVAAQDGRIIAAPRIA